MGRHVDQYVGLHSADMAAGVSADISVDMWANTQWRVGQHVDQYGEILLDCW